MFRVLGPPKNVSVKDCIRFVKPHVEELIAPQRWVSHYSGMIIANSDCHTRPITVEEGSCTVLFFLTGSWKVCYDDIMLAIDSPTLFVCFQSVTVQTVGEESDKSWSICICRVRVL
jgi:hypothetical protein